MLLIKKTLAGFTKKEQVCVYCLQNQIFFLAIFKLVN